MKFIKSIVDLINFAIDKGEAGYYPPSEIVDQVNDTVLDMFNEFIKRYPGDKTINKYLDQFKKSKTFLVVNGDVNIKNLNWAKDRFCVNISDRTFSIDSTDEFYSKASSTALPPSEAYPIACIENDVLKVRPRSLKFTFHYLGFPEKAVYATDIIDDEEVYNDSDSIDIQFPQMIHPDIQNRVLEKLGINLRDSTLIEFSNIQQQKEAR